MPLKPHPNDPDKMVYVSRQYDIPQPQGIPQLQGVTTAQPAQEPVCPECKVGVLYECVACSSSNYPPKPAQEPWPEEPFGHMAGGVQPPQRPWVETTEGEWFEWWRVSAIADSTEAEIDFGDFLIIAQAVTAKLKEDNK